jgi:hypothetical protein
MYPKKTEPVMNMKAVRICSAARAEGIGLAVDGLLFRS